MRRTDVEFAGFALFRHQDGGVIVSSGGETCSRTQSTLRSRRLISQFQVSRLTSSVAGQNVLHPHTNYAHTANLRQNHSFTFSVRSGRGHKFVCASAN